jgi:hypothetical protein
MAYGPRRGSLTGDPRHGLVEAVAVAPRSLEQIDGDLDVERAIWIMERRAGRSSPEVAACQAQIDRLLEERIEACKVT